MNDIDHISSLPVELLRYFCTYLANRGIKSLRLACKLLVQRDHTRQTLVLLSAEPCNKGVGTVRDTFEPDHERPNLDSWMLAWTGYHKRDRFIA